MLLRLLNNPPNTVLKNGDDNNITQELCSQNTEKRNEASEADDNDQKLLCKDGEPDTSQFVSVSIASIAPENISKPVITNDENNIPNLFLICLMD